MGTSLNGYIKLHRQMLNWGWYDDINTKMVFLHLLLTANFKDTEWHGIQLKRGDVVTSIPSLATALKLSERNVRTAISHLKTTGEVTDKTFSKFRIISIKNYNQYQDDDRQSASQPTDNRQQRKNDKNVRMKEGKNVVVNENCKKVFDIFNQTCLSLEPVINPTELNKRRVSELLQQHSDFNFYDYFLRVEKSDFLTGRNGRWNMGGTKANFDWLLNLKNVVKIQSGQFDNTKEQYNGTHSRGSEEGDSDVDLSRIGEWL